MNQSRSLSAAGVLGAALLFAVPAQAQQVYKIGVAAGLTGYAAAVDRAWRDGLEVAVDYVNGKGGVLGRKLQLVVEDNKSEPQEAVTVYRKMISSDKVDIFISGCVSAGNFAAAPLVVRAGIPMVLCSILPPQPEQVKWAFSFLAPPRFEVEKRYEYLKANTQIRKVGVLHDPSPYANLQKGIAEKIAPDFGIEVPVVEQYKQDDADFSPQISKMNAAGAKAVIKIGLGGSTLTTAKNIKQLGLDMLLLGSIDDLAVFKPTGETLGAQFMFVAAPAQVYEALPDGALKAEIGRFLPLWRAKHGERDPFWGGKAWDAVMVTMAAIEKANSVEGAKVRDAIETISGFQGTGGVYNFSPTVHQGITTNPFFMATMVGGKVQVK
ncbi:MAG: ABC transporter substrate-binding protein [Rhodoplanes sp.]|uniref:ABC transporter substrate-binding protein n=1 Tax=Rhodoplanes sp. TaxID=1968906 RepID=UPI00185A3A54|nr:ABC transporter substrate-binding protein [Rhodoplanes sp.]NVO13415.1 ABC transporter substrate-binding protein [Rhodoplanes sp.]